MLNKDIAKRVGLGLLAVSAITLPSVLFAAEDVTAMTGRLKTQITAAQAFLTTVAQIAGVGFVLGGIMKFKAHKDNPTQVPLSVPFTLLIIGGALLALPTVVGTAQKSVGGSEDVTVTRQS